MVTVAAISDSQEKPMKEFWAVVVCLGATSTQAPVEAFRKHTS
jgi:hypothetical protein